MDGEQMVAQEATVEFGCFSPHIWSPHSLRGTVEGHSVREVGIWLFKKRTPIIKVKLKSDQQSAFNNLMSDKGEFGRYIEEVVYLGLTAEQIPLFPVGSEVGITFGYAGGAAQFFYRVEPLALMRLQIVNGDSKLENEVRVA